VYVSSCLERVPRRDPFRRDAIGLNLCLNVGSVGGRPLVCAFLVEDACPEATPFATGCCYDDVARHELGVVFVRIGMFG
jgi:hypothetical protein